MASPTENITALILAGGRARRLGGRDKGLTRLGDQPLIAHVIERLRPQVAHILISANRNREHYAAFGFPVLSDQQADYAGPLAGMASAVGHVATPRLLSVPCDAPLLPPQLAARLDRALDESGKALAVAHDGQRLQPLFMLLEKNLLEDLRASVAQGRHKVRDWVGAHDPVVVDFSDCPRCFLNVNDERDLQRAEQYVSSPA